MKKNTKGSCFERDTCKKLSLWVSRGKNPNLFWRTPNSGGRATVNHSKGGKNIVGYGDIQATCREGEPLIKRVCFELKRGYPKATPTDLLDNKSGKEWGLFIEQAMSQQKKAKTRYWALITKRDRRETLITSTLEFFIDGDLPFQSIDYIDMIVNNTEMVSIRFEDFLEKASYRKFVR